MSFWQFIDKHADGLGILAFVVVMLAAFIATEITTAIATRKR